MSGTTSIQGIGASPGIALGTACVIDARRVRTPKVKLAAHHIEPEVMRFNTAIALSDSQLEDLKTRVVGVGREGAEHALILEAHRLILHDPMFVNEVIRLIRERSCNAEWAVRQVSRLISARFRSLSDAYFRERRSDVEFVSDRVLRNLLGEVVDRDLELPAGAIVVAHDISPADAALLMQTTEVAAFVCGLGGETSHTAIIARSRAIPAIVGAGRAIEAIRNGDFIGVDATRGLVLLHPSEAQQEELRAGMRALVLKEEQALKSVDLAAVTRDGVRIALFGNIEFPEEIADLLAHGGEGVGLYRSEFLFLNRSEPPSEEDQFGAYRQILIAMGERQVTIRTLDLGGDKIPGKKPKREPNPALGLRAIRYCLKNREVFRVQLRALLRASVHGNLRVMFPLVSSISELREARAELEACRTQLSHQGVPVGKRFPIGIMMETPSAAWTADRLAQEADFFSIGTNDLIQYSMAIDRQNRDVAYLYRPLHLSILRSLESIVRSAKAAGIPVAMCGEMAGDQRLTIVLLALGIEELSMSAGQIPVVKQVIRRVSKADAVEVLAKAMAFSSAEEIERFLRVELTQRFGENSPMG